MIGILIGLALLMFLAYKGYSIIWVAPITAMVVALTGGLDLLPAYTDTYMTGLVGFAKSWFPAFMLGAIFGQLMDYTGAAESIAELVIKKIGPKYAILAVVLSCAVLTYGGVSLFVVVFAIYPLAVALFREADIPRRLIPGSIALGSFTFTMTAVPGTPQTQNLIPMKYFGTTPTAAPIMGIVAAIFIFGLGMLYMNHREKVLRDKGEHFDEPTNLAHSDDEDKKIPHPLLAALPLISVVVILNIILPMYDKRMGTSIVQQGGIIVSLLIGIVLTMLINPSMYKGFPKKLNDGASSSLTAIMNTSAAVGFGSVVRAVPGFQVLTDMILGLGGSPLISLAVAVNVLAGATGSASGGMGIALEALAEQYIGLAEAHGISLEAMHRVASLASGGLDTLPHNGAVLTLLAGSGMTHKESYREIFVTSVILPALSSIPAIILASLGLV